MNLRSLCVFCGLVALLSACGGGGGGDGGIEEAAAGAAACDGKSYEPLALQSIDSIVAVGDSNTELLNLPPADRWSALLQASLPPATVVHNLGKGGETTTSAIGRLPEVFAAGPDVVLVMLGTNDAGMLGVDAPRTSREQFESNLGFMICEIRTRGAIPVLMTAIPIIEGTGADGYYYSTHPVERFQHVGGAKSWLHAYNLSIAKVADEKRVWLVRTEEAIVGEAGGSSDEALIQSGLINGTGYHFSSQGSAVVHTEIMKPLAP